MFRWQCCNALEVFLLFYVFALYKLQMYIYLLTYLLTYLQLLPDPEQGKKKEWKGREKRRTRMVGKGRTRRE